MLNGIMNRIAGNEKLGELLKQLYMSHYKMGRTSSSSIIATACIVFGCYMVYRRIFGREGLFIDTATGYLAGTMLAIVNDVVFMTKISELGILPSSIGMVGIEKILFSSFIAKELVVNVLRNLFQGRKNVLNDILLIGILNAVIGSYGKAVLVVSAAYILFQLNGIYFHRALQGLKIKRYGYMYEKDEYLEMMKKVNIEK